MGTLAEDLKYALRVYRKKFGFTLIAVITLALGIGASTAVFVVVNTILLKPLPYPDSQRIVFPWRQAPPGLNLGYNEIPWGVPSYRLMMQNLNSFESLGAFKSDSFNLTGSGDPVRLQGLRASYGVFPALGVKPALGRTFAPEDDQPGNDRKVVLSHELWQERFGGASDILGRSIDLNGSAYTIVGVMPPGFVFPHGEEMPASFDFPRKATLWVPLAPPVSVPEDAPDELAVVAKLKPGITLDQSQNEMNVLSARMEVALKAKGWFNSKLVSFERQVSGDARKPLWLMFGAVGAVLLIACSNVANLLLARAIERKTEFTLRAAIGAGRGRLVRQLFTESLVLSSMGGALGAALAYAGIYFLKIFGPANIPRLQEISLDLPVLAFVLGVSLISGLIFGLAPLLGFSRDNLGESLKEGGQRSGGSTTRLKARNALVVVEVALAMVLVVAAGLLSQTFFHLLNVDAGVNIQRVLTFELSLPSSKYAQSDTMVALYDKVLKALPGVPGVEASGIVRTIPLNGATEGSIVRVPGRVAKSRQDRPVSNYNIASPGYFSAIGTPILQGREFLETDKADSMPVVIVNNALAKKFWPGQNAIGKQIGLASLQYPLMTVVGIVADVKHISLREEVGPEMYVPLTQKPFPSMAVMSAVLRTRTNPSAVIGGVRNAIHSIDPDLPIAQVETLATIKSNSMAQPRFAMLLLASFGLLAVLLACIGMYGVISYSVVQRTQEIGVRMALGAPQGAVFGMVVRQGASLAGLGILIGLATAFGLTRLMATFLYGIRPADPITFAGVSMLLATVAVLACYLPARRATQVDPLIALRYE